MKLVFKKPDKSTPGFLRRSKRALQLAKLNLIENPESIDELVNFLSDFVTEPVEQSEKIEALYDASEEQFNQMLDALTGGGASSIPPVISKES